MPPKFLVIVESPSKCSKIEDYLGPNYQCISSKGHFREITSLSDIDTKHSFHPTYTVIPEKADHVAKMRKIIAKYAPAHIFLATDDDREGEAIAWHICDEFQLPIASTKRIVFHEITKPAILAAIEHPVFLNQSLAFAAKTRQILDMLVGFKLSPLLWRNVSSSSKKHALSAGRCQTPALRLVHDNDQLIKHASNDTVWKVHGVFFAKCVRFRLSVDFSERPALDAFLLASQTHSHVFSIGPTKSSTQSPPKPFTTSRLLQHASSHLHLSPKTTMELCQSLYQLGLITYMRTDSTKFSPVFLEKAREYIVSTYRATDVGDLAAIEQTDGTQPHEAIRVTNLALRHFQHENQSLSRLYGVIWKHSVQSCMSAYQSQKTALRISAPENHTYEHVIEVPVHLGWKQLEPAQEPEESNRLFYFQSWDIKKPVPWTKIDSELSLVSRQSHYTEASLIQQLETLGIGRPSTFATIVTTLVDRGYVKKTDVKGRVVHCVEPYLDPEIKVREFDKVFGQEKGKLVLQPIGSLALAFLLDHFDPLFAYTYTESMEQSLDAIATLPAQDAEKAGIELCRQCLHDLLERMEPLKRAKKQSFSLAESNYELVFSSYGVSVKHVLDDGTKEYIPVKEDMEVDLEKAKRGEYTLDELVDQTNTHLGVYEGENVVIKTGRFGKYAAWGKQTLSLKSCGSNPITMTDFLQLVERQGDKSQAPMQSQDTKNTLRTLTPHLSIRKGKFGAYIYLKKPDMEKPEFYPLKSLRGKWESMDTPALLQWIENTYHCVFSQPKNGAPDKEYL